MYKTILEFDDGNTHMKVEVSPLNLVRIHESGRRIIVSVEGLADITAAVEQYLEIESAAEYIDDIVPLED